MKSDRKRFKRRNYLINPRFQLRFMFYLVAAVLFGLCALYISNLWYFDVLVAQGLELGLDAEHPYYEFIKEQQALLINTYVAVSSVVFVVLIVFGLLLSHRIAGPLYRIRTYMKQVAVGETDLEPVRLRKGDFFWEVATSLNDMLRAMKDRENGKEEKRG